MVPSVAGLLVFLAVFAVGRLLGSGPVIGLLASLPFGSTAFATLTAVGGSTPLIYALFAVFLILHVAMRREVRRGLAKVFTLFVSSWVVLLLGAYTIVSSILLPRLFEGKTTAFVVFEGFVTELPLHPTSGNITQTAYFTLGLLCFFAFAVILQDRNNIAVVRRGFFAYIIINPILGFIDLLGKSAGVGDLLEPIRTAGYSYLIDVEAAGFWRIAGGFAEASAFAGAGLAGLAFTFAYWQRTRHNSVVPLMGIILVLLLLSTSSTAYVCLAVLALAAGASIAANLLRARVYRLDLVVILLGAIFLFVAIALFLANEQLFQPAIDLLESAVLNKASSDSGIERLYWNTRSFEHFIETGFLGIGMGSSRSSSLIISVMAQLGIIGTLLFLFLIGVIVRGVSGLHATPETQSLFALASGARAAALITLVGASVAGSGADPGILFFVELATIVACRHHIRQHNETVLLRAAARRSRTAHGSTRRGPKELKPGAVPDPA